MHNMRRSILILLFIGTALATINGQTKQASQSAALRPSATNPEMKRTVDLINGLQVMVTFDIEGEHIWFNGSTKNNPSFITEFIPLDDPDGSNIEKGKSYILDNLYVTMEYKILEITNNRVTRIWYRVAAKTTDLPQQPWI